MINLSEKARAFAVKAHRKIDHRRKYTGERYEVHLFEVASPENTRHRVGGASQILRGFRFTAFKAGVGQIKLKKIIPVIRGFTDNVRATQTNGEGA